MRKAPIHQTERQRAAIRAGEWLALDAVVAFFGSQAALARHFGVTYQAVQQWYEKGVPIEHCPEMETITRGLVQCEALRADFGKLNQRPYKRVERVGPANGKQRIYVAGPMTGYPDLKFPAFHAEAKRLRAAGLEVFNPAELNLGVDPTWEDCMRADIRQMMRCNTVSLLPGWESSRGAELEHTIAKTLKFDMMLAGEPA